MNHFADTNSMSLMCRLGDNWTGGERMRRFVASYCVKCRLHSVAAAFIVETAPLQRTRFSQLMAERRDIGLNVGVCVALVGFGMWLIKREKLHVLAVFMVHLMAINRFLQRTIKAIMLQ